MADCFDKILTASCNSDVDKYKVIIKLVKDLENGISDALRFRNCLLLLVNLCFKKEYCDYTDRIGRPSQELSEQEKVQMIELLRSEFNN
ncbi:hypothetical protein LCGC14_0875950 [marine sediment metagenome]|uniref:Uncharacterized protein n=1 Tax=marine sediment metagenome TaxID=412755 RepID=A0A0F9P3F3_9ZZZZ|nr:MAG: hypothetical protein Lokiarch_06120 [Candidatus Lokiarchaeum sp. GC14_75]HEC38346.1 hypothetical protein [bacterium]